MIFFTILFSVSAQKMSNLGGKIVPRSEYEAALPYVNTARLRLRDYPSTEYGNTIAILEMNRIVNLHSKTEELDQIDGSNSPWYEVQLRNDISKKGWVYGKYLDFRVGYPEPFWEPEIIINIGDNFEKLNNVFGNYYSVANDIIEFQFDDLREVYFLRIKLNDDKIKEIQLIRYFD